MTIIVNKVGEKPSEPTGAGSGALFDAITSAADSAQMGIAITFGAGEERNLYVNSGASRLLGYAPEELFERSLWSLVAPGDRARLEEIQALGLDGDSAPVAVESTLVHRSGRLVPVEIAATPVLLNGRLVSVWFFFDIADRLQAAEELRSSEARFRSLVESAPDGVLILVRGRVAYVNLAGARMFGEGDASDVVGLTVGDLLQPEMAAAAEQRFNELIETGAIQQKPWEYKTRSVSGRELSIEVTAITIEYEGMPAVLAFARDVTIRNAIQARLIQADRLAAVGMLAAGVAHEINNPLAYVLLNLHYLEKQVSKLNADPVRVKDLLAHLEEARHGAQRVQTIVRDLRTFARADEDAQGPVDLTQAIESAVNIAEHEIRHRARLVRNYQELPMVSGNSARLEQVFLNLLVNATQALSESNTPRSEIRITLKPLDDLSVLAEVSDTGPGIPPHILNRIFDPFFTTKPAGVGTGLGLSICRSIITAIGGSIEAESTLGVGTCFRVILKAYDGEGERETVDALVTRRFTLPPARRGRVLIVDDEASVASMLGCMVEEEHDVDIVHSGKAALARLEQSAGAYDAVLCDLMMPEMTGMDLYRRILVQHPGLEKRVVFMTGGAFLPQVAEFLETVENPKVEKPFDLEKVRKVLKQLSKKD